MSRWSAVNLGDIAESIDYGVTASAKQHPPGPKFLRITDIQDGTVRWGGVPWCDCDSASAAKARLRSGDIVFARTGATTGKSFLIGECPADAVFASYLIRVRLPATVDARYVGHYFQTPQYWSQIANGARGAAQPGVNATTLKSLTLPLPPLPEQRRIAAILDKADELRAKRRAAVAELNGLTQAVFLEMFGDPALNPYGWKTLPLSDCCTDINDCPHSTPSWAEQGIVCLRTSNVTVGGWNWEDTRYVTEEEFHRRSVRGYVMAGDIILSREGTVGIAAIVTPGMTVCMGQRLVQLRPASSVVLPDFLLSVLLYELAPERIGRVMVGATSQHLNVRDLKALRVPVPPVNMQRKFSETCRSAAAVAHSAQGAVDKHDALFEVLQHRAFAGEL